MSKKTRKPKEYKKKLENDYAQIDAAVECANAKQAEQIAQDLENVASKLKSPTASGDASVSGLVNAANDISTSLLILASASRNYGSQVEPCYKQLKIQLNALESTEESYEKLCNNGPDSDNKIYHENKYNSTTGQYYDDFNEAKYNENVDNWNRKLDKYETKLDSMVTNVNRIKDQLRNAGEADIGDVATEGFNLTIPDIIPFTDNNLFRPDSDSIPLGLNPEGKEEKIEDEEYEVKYDSDNKPYVQINGKKYPIGEFVEDESTAKKYGYIVVGADGKKFTIFNQSELGWPGDCNRAGICSIASGYADDDMDVVKKAKGWSDGLGYDQNVTNKFLEDYGLEAKVTGGKYDVRKFETCSNSLYDTLNQGNKVMVHILPEKNKNGAYGASGQKWASSMHWIDFLDTKKVGNEIYVFVSDSGHKGTLNDTGTGYGKGWYNIKEFDKLDINYVTVVSPKKTYTV